VFETDPEQLVDVNLPLELHGTAVVLVGVIRGKWKRGAGGEQGDDDGKTQGKAEGCADRRRPPRVKDV
jgi:hypothetical protein